MFSLEKTKNPSKTQRQNKNHNKLIDLKTEIRQQTKDQTGKIVSADKVSTGAKTQHIESSGKTDMRKWRNQKTSKPATTERSQTSAFRCYTINSINKIKKANLESIFMLEYVSKSK